MRLLSVPVLLAALVGGQAPAASVLSRVGKVAWAPVRYAGARGQDLLDVFEINVGIGRTAKLDLKYGVHFFCVGDVRAWRAGTIDRRAGTWRETDEGLSLFPLSLLGWPVHWAADACRCRGLLNLPRYPVLAKQFLRLTMTALCRLFQISPRDSPTSVDVGAAGRANPL